jgi:Cu2+-exporting ATPase
MAHAQQQTQKNARETVTFTVKNMDCANCVQKVEKNIAFERGVTDLACELPTKTVKVTYRTDRTTEDNLIAAFKKIGFEAEKKEEDAKPADDK